MINRIQYLDQIELETKDVAHECIKVAVISVAGTYLAGLTTFTVNTTSGFQPGDEIYINDKTLNSKFTTVNSIIDATHIKVTGDYHSILVGGVIKKSEASQHLDKALLIYSKYQPLEKIEKVLVPVPANVFDLPDDWDMGFSSVRYIEYPIDNMPLSMLKEKDFEIFLNDSNKYQLRFAYDLSTAYRLSYNIAHSFNTDNPALISSPASDAYCICDIAAAYYLLSLSARYGQSVKPEISADTVDYNTKTDQYRRLAKELMGHAASWLGISVSNLDGSELEQEASSANQEIEPSTADKRETLFHSGRYPIIYPPASR
jgi:hypothetical protein